MIIFLQQRISRYALLVKDKWSGGGYGGYAFLVRAYRGELSWRCGFHGQPRH